MCLPTSEPVFDIWPRWKSATNKIETMVTWGFLNLKLSKNDILYTYVVSKCCLVSIFFYSFHVNLEWFLMPKHRVNKRASLLGMWQNVLVLVIMFRGSPQSSLSTNNYKLPPNPWVLCLFKLESETLKAQMGKQKTHTSSYVCEKHPSRFQHPHFLHH